jgi:5-methylcytosine-specific restriction endonuclease McrA
MSRSWAGGSTRRWRKTRAAVLLANANENGGRCQLAIKGVCTGMAEQVHHTKGKAHGDRIEDLVAACKACNLRVGNPGRISPEPRPVSRW